MEAVAGEAAAGEVRGGGGRRGILLGDVALLGREEERQRRGLLGLHGGAWRMEKRLRRYCAAAFRVHRVRLCVERRRAWGYPRPRVRDMAHAACGSCGVRGLAMCKTCGLVPGMGMQPTEAAS